MRDQPLIRKPEDVLAFKSVAPALLHDGGTDFRIEHFDIRDEEGNVLGVLVQDADASTEASADGRRVQLSSDYLKCRVVRSHLQFSVGSTPIESLRMIERHFAQGQLFRTFDFTLGYCMPNSSNSHEVLYELPQLSPRASSNLARHPVSIDTFFFAGERLVRAQCPLCWVLEPSLPVSSVRLRIMHHC